MSSSLSLFNYSSSSSPSDSSKDKEDKNSVNFGSPFPEAILNTPYQYIPNVPGEYDIYLDSSGYHWYIMVHYKVEGGNLPKISFEITCDKLFKGDLIPTMRVVEENDSDTEIVARGRAVRVNVARGPMGVDVVDDAKAGDAAGPVGSVHGSILGNIAFAAVTGAAIGAALGVTTGGMRTAMLAMSGVKLHKVGTMKTTIMKLCETAEAIRVGMGKFNLFTNNCQHFCNNVLEKLGLPTTPTTVGPTTTKVNFDEIDQIFTIHVVPHKQGDESDGGMKG